MSIFNFLKKKTPTENIVKENFNSQEIKELFATPINNRNELWMSKFNNAIKAQHFEVLQQNIFEDRTGMKYLNLKISHKNGKPINDFIDKCLEEGIGIYINENESVPEWLFTYGDLLGYHQNGVFYSTQFVPPFTGTVTDRMLLEQKARIGQPSEQFLPKQTRQQIKSFFETFGLKNVKIALVLWIENGRLTLAFEIIPEMFKNPNEDSLQSLLQFTGWFLPYHYDIVFIHGNEDFKYL